MSFLECDGLKYGESLKNHLIVHNLHFCLNSCRHSALEGHNRIHAVGWRSSLLACGVCREESGEQRTGRKGLRYQMMASRPVVRARDAFSVVANPTRLDGWYFIDRPSAEWRLTATLRGTSWYLQAVSSADLQSHCANENNKQEVLQQGKYTLAMP